MKKNSLLTALLILTTATCVVSQNLEYNRFYMFNMKTINPAYTAKDQLAQLTIMGEGNVLKKKYNGDDLSSSLISYEQYAKKLNSGIGVQFSNDNHFANSRRIALMYRYGLQLGNAGTLSFGLGGKIGIIHRPFVDDNGDNIGDKNSINPIVDAGISYSYKKFHFGISLLNLNKPVYYFGSHKYSYTSYLQTLNLTTGYKFTLTKWMTLEPLLFFTTHSASHYRYDLATVNIQLQFLNRLYLGGGFSYEENSYYTSDEKYRNFYANAGVTFLKRVELVSLLYFNNKGINNTYEPSKYYALNYEFVMRVKL